MNTGLFPIYLFLTVICYCIYLNTNYESQDKAETMKQGTRVETVHEIQKEQSHPTPEGTVFLTACQYIR